MKTIEIMFGRQYRHVLSFVKIDSGDYDKNVYFDDARIDNRSIYQFPAEVVAEAEKAIDRYL